MPGLEQFDPLISPRQEWKGLLQAEVRVCPPPCAGGSEAASRDLSGVVVASCVSSVSIPLTKGSGMVASDESSSTCCGTWAVGPSYSLRRED